MGSIANRFLRMKIRGTLSKNRPGKIFYSGRWAGNTKTPPLVNTK
jgi:hypothetical protein